MNGLNTEHCLSATAEQTFRFYCKLSTIMDLILAHYHITTLLPHYLKHSLINVSYRYGNTSQQVYNVALMYIQHFWHDMLIFLRNDNYAEAQRYSSSTMHLVQ